MNFAAPDRITPDRLMGFTFGFAPPAIIETGLRLGIFDLLDKGARPIDEIVASSRASPRGLRILLNALVGLDLLAKDRMERFSLTPESAHFLVSGKPTFHGAFFMLTSERMLSEWGKLSSIVRSGRPTHRINEEESGTKFFQQFVENIFPIHFPAARCLAHTLQLSNLTSPALVLDLAAGSGVWSVAMAKESPHVAVTAIDWPGIIPITRKVTEREGVAGLKFTYKYANVDSKENVSVPQAGSFTTIGGATINFPGFVTISPAEINLKHQLALVPTFGRAFGKVTIYAGGGPALFDVQTKFVNGVGFAVIGGQTLSVTGAPMNASNDNWVWGGAAQVGATYAFAPHWFLDVGYTYARSASFNIQDFFSFANQNGALTSSGTAFLNAQERVTNQSVALTLNRQF
jgi:opacity protein-like surface antigen